MVCEKCLKELRSMSDEELMELLNDGVEKFRERNVNLDSHPAHSEW